MTLEESYRQEGLETTSWDQFTVNREKFGVEAQFNEALYTVPMSSYQINEEEWREVVSLAREMGDGDGTWTWGLITRLRMFIVESRRCR